MKYRACSNKMVNTPGMFEWLMRVKARDINKDARDIGARMYMLADLLPSMPSTMLKLVAEGSDKVEVEIDRKAGTVSFQLKEEEKHVVH